MTDKQIMIDGVDVSGCEWLNHNQLCECAIKPADDFHCHARPNCHYKQIQRLDEECKTLASQLSFVCKQKECLEQECERLKGKNNYSPEVLKQCPHYKNDNICTYLGYETKCEGDCNYTAFQDFIAEIDDLKNVNSKLQQQLDQLKVENEQLKKAEEYDSRYNDLQAEIDCGEKIISQLKQTLTEIKEIAEDNFYYLDCDYRWILEQILQKISECEGNDETNN